MKSIVDSPSQSRDGNARGFPVLRVEQTGARKEFSPRAFAVYGPKVIATRRYFEDKALESRCITEELVQGRVRRGVPLSLPDAFHQAAETLRNKLLLWRFLVLSIGRRLVAPAAAADLEPRVAQVFAPLLAVATDEKARERIAARAQEAGEELRSDREDSLEADMLGVVRELQEEEATLSVSAIAEHFRERHGFDLRKACHGSLDGLRPPEAAFSEDQEEPWGLRHPARGGAEDQEALPAFRHH